MKLYYLRIKNVEKKDAEEKLKKSKAKLLSSTIEKQIRFRLEPSVKFQNKKNTVFNGNSWLTINSREGSSTIQMEESNFEGTKSDKSEVKIDNFFNAAKMLISAMPKNDYEYVEISKTIYWFDGATVLIEELPLLHCTIIISATSKKKLDEIKEKLKINGTIEPNFNMSNAERYYRIRGIDYDIIKTVLKKKLNKELGI